MTVHRTSPDPDPAAPLDAVTVDPEDVDTPDALRLIAESAAELALGYPPEQRFGFSPEQMRAHGVWLVVARRRGVAVGCGGLATFDGYGELKRIFVTRAARGQGVSHAICDALEARARAVGLPVVRLETGDAQTAALALYTRRGYRRIGRFGDYPPCPTSVYMEKTL